MNNSPNILICMLSDRSFYREVMFSPNELFCGPDTETVIEDGIYKSYKTTEKHVDIAELITKFPPSQKPNIIIVKPDPTQRLIPTNLEAVEATKVLILGDTHHQKKPIQFLLDYAKSHHFDIVLSDHDRHHLHWFYKAGIENLYWIPSINIKVEQKPEWQPNREKELLFIGGFSKEVHPIRHNLLSRIAQEKEIKLTIKGGTPEEALEWYQESLISLNISMNGDLNLRVFEVLAAGGFLLTDTLSEESGLYTIFEEGIDFVSYSTYDDLVQKTIYYLNHPEEALEIAHNGYKKFWQNHSPDQKRADLFSLIEQKNINPMWLMSRDNRCQNSLSKSTFQKHLEIYETVQEIHREIVDPTIFIDPALQKELTEELSDLPRLLFQEQFQTDFLYDIVILSEETFKNNAPIIGDSLIYNLIIYSTNKEITEESIQLLESMSFQNGSEHFLFTKDVDKAGEQYLEEGKIQEGFLFFKRLFDADRTTPRTLYNLGKLFWQIGDETGALEMLHQSLEQDTSFIDTLYFLAQMAYQKGNTKEAITYMHRLNASLPEKAPFMAFLAQLLEKDNQLEEALLLYKKIVTILPEQQEIIDKVSDVTQKIEKRGPLPHIQHKRVLLVTNLYPPQELGGYGRLMYDFMTLLAQRGHTIHVLSSDTSYLGEIQEEETGVTRRLRLYGKWENGAFINDSAERMKQIVASNQKELEKSIVEFTPECILVGNLDFVDASLIATIQKYDLPMVHHLGNISPGYSPNATITTPLYRPATCSNWLREELWKEGYMFPTIDVVYPSGKVDYYYREELPSSKEILKIAFAGIVQSYKGPQTLIEALVILSKNNIPFEATIAGTTTAPLFYEKLQKRVKDTGLDKQIHFVGYLEREQLREMFYSHNCYVQPSLFQEPFGISQVEAMAAGLIPLISATGGSKEVSVNGVSGLHFDATDPVSLAKSLIYLHRNREKWLPFQKAAQKRVMNNFNIAQSVDRLEEIFAELLRIKEEQSRKEGR